MIPLFAMCSFGCWHFIVCRGLSQGTWCACSPLIALLAGRYWYDLRTTPCGVNDREHQTASPVGGTDATSAFDVLHLDLAILLFLQGAKDGAGVE